MHTAIYGEKISTMRYDHSPQAAERIAARILSLLPTVNSDLTPGVYVDPKADYELAPQLSAMLERGALYQAECARRGVRFLPSQVMRPLYAAKGLEFGVAVKPRADDFLMLRVQG